MISTAAIRCSRSVAKAAQTSARQCQNLGESFRGVVSVTLMKRRAYLRFEHVRTRATIMAVDLLNLLRVNQALSLQLSAGAHRPTQLSNYWLHAGQPHVD